MIYAHRGPDLVVAIMGTLLAGATFSVIDPQYPADRQIIYLDVARPKALVIIEKATEKAGKLADKVEEWIKANLELHTTLPALRLENDGTVVGGLISGRDALDDAQKLKASPPGIVVGPDSTPTLSFTSGSEGRPKGVRGRHFSLTHYFPWMKERFNMSENERFTMLSGIAHDPIQRDIFTPLFLGAQILVPSAEDIQHERLAEWMREHKCTVTHLTPAMGQILVGGASAQFPSLKLAFFVGDILIKRDVRLLQELAENCTVINMFGTTETQRAVSYFAIPSRKAEPNAIHEIPDKIPAGRGMQNVQLLVVDRNNPERICGVGEEGEIYVRAAGLAEGYLGLDDFTKTKFIANWFVKDSERWSKQDQAEAQHANGSQPWRQFYQGPRDRLYRSGDLGHYTESGDVACTGRADMQVKIRGFRIELGEIDSHLSKHDLIRDNVTLVRRDKDEEQTLVSYIVPEFTRWNAWLREKGLEDNPNATTMVEMLKRFRLLRDEVRQYLKDKLPVYAVPSVVIPLARMPLNPNGKIDRPALPFPDAEELSAAMPRRPSIDVSKLTETQNTIAKIWSEVLDNVPVRTIALDDSFFELGGHSLSAQRVLLKLRKNYDDQIDVSMRSFYEYPQLKSFAAEVDRARDPHGHVLDFESVNTNKDMKQPEAYADDADALAKQLPVQIPTAKINIAKPLSVLLTGATGFLGTFTLRQLLRYTGPNVNVIAHVRAKTDEDALSRIRKTCAAYGTWDNAWSSRIQAIAGDLGKERLGVSQQTWDKLASEVDVIIHNGAKVHWVEPYSTLKTANVYPTMSLIRLAATGKPKQMAFVSSTSVLDTEAFAQKSDEIIRTGGQGISEDDDLESSRRGLSNGYGQTKWASEYLMREAGRRGLSGAIIRPGYVTGESTTGISITDDFIIRMLRGSQELEARPDIRNTVNMVPVDHVARVVVAAALHPPVAPLGVVHVTSHPRMQWSDFLECAESYGYPVPEKPYAQWKDLVVDHVGQGKEFAL
ncbi:hypothetical protein FH972_021947 [Carpinus fangiana]|uniref:Alpha-aminoadipate reductase n=1 Tax=Carpinus fangiana TaxID=176857 RepID=A0A5N6KR58_9ROSI|nr:hypothetical protein FH972_021947 [Carpinus fangiana]